MLLLHLEEHGKGRAHAHLFGVAGVDAGHDRLGHLGERFAPEPPAHEIAEALVVAGVAARQHEVEPHAQLAAPGDQARQGERHEPGRHHQDQALGQLVQPPARKDVALADVFVGVEQALGDADLAGQLHGPGLVGDERVGAAFDDETVDTLSADLAAEVVGAFEKDPVEGRCGAGPCLTPGGLERMSGAETGHAAPDHRDDGELLAHRAPARRVLAPGRRCRRSEPTAGAGVAFGCVTTAAGRAGASDRDRARPGGGSAGGRGSRSRCRRAPR